jgi:hypothetical protein
MDAIHDEGVVTEIDHPIQGEVTKPPILAWVTKIHELSPIWIFSGDLQPFVRLNFMVRVQRRYRDGLGQYNHPYSYGFDDSPLGSWDAR